jgi:hypothetical protein
MTNTHRFHVIYLAAMLMTAISPVTATADDVRLAQTTGNERMPGGVEAHPSEPATRSLGSDGSVGIGTVSPDAPMAVPPAPPMDDGVAAPETAPSDDSAIEDPLIEDPVIENPVIEEKNTKK